ncbi:Photosystem I assembly protein Ycf3 [Poriferisphaera corsica]|uniref:Photosystem I assembly protein Ycf3 n=1 Tax=Poriferisphaera corsica TaxID=2528020 RepID=A0A517YWI4_9BACT|nr:tetratricopeptide repeat protein [Poriferisphaera corsica]QDU34569.1 Photosystem I assembly protein Ycf3 [Poriferisphaera corsica]
MKHTIPIIILTALITVFVGCVGLHDTDVKTYQSPVKAKADQAQKAADLNSSAVNYIEQNNLNRAEQLLKEALTEDMTYAPAHNNLGLVYYRLHQYYTAAWEFEYAAKLMDNAAEPLNNLGMVYEAVGQYKKAHDYYKQAYQADSENVQVIANFARNHVRQGLRNDQLRDLLEEIVLRDDRNEWVAWAREQRAVIGK